VEGAVERYHALFDWLGTDDFSSWAVLPDVLRIVGGLQPGGWEGLMKRNHDLILDGRRIVSEAIGTELPAPDDMIGSMASVVLPEARGVPANGDLSPLMGELSEEGVSVIVQLWPEWPHQLIRISAHLYNSADDYHALADRLRLRLS
jgi:isopenicillin-N epimerase